MFDIGFWEIAVIAVVALLVVGPDEFPSLVRNMAGWVGRLRRFLSETKNDLSQEFRKADELKNLINKEIEIAEEHENLNTGHAAVPAQARQPDATLKPEQSVREESERHNPASSGSAKASSSHGTPD